jgi:hypothetical protein
MRSDFATRLRRAYPRADNSAPLATTAGYLSAVILACLSGVHAYWALGGHRDTGQSSQSQPGEHRS